MIPTEDRSMIEEHLAGCDKCRGLLSDAYEITKKSTTSQIKEKVMKWIKENPWFIASMTAFVCSFVFPKYFLQLLVACLITGAKWIIDSKTTKMLIMIHEAWKRGDREEVLSWNKNRS